MLKIGVTGTDTGAGKTIVAAALLAWMRAREIGRVSGMKPVETGVPPGACGRDATLLRAAAGDHDAVDDVCPVTLPAPLAPLVASRVAGTPIDLDTLAAAFGRLCHGRSAVVVEGAGGLLTPITPTVAYDGLFRWWELELVIVAPNRLGALNHALLTARAATAAGLRVRSVVLNDVPPVGEPVVRETNLATLDQLLPGTPVVRFPSVPEPTSLVELAAAAAVSELHDAIGLA